MRNVLSSFWDFKLIMNSNMARKLVLYEFYDLSQVRGEWPSGPASSTSLTEVKHDCVLSETGRATFQVNNQRSSLCRLSEGTLN